MNSSPSSGRAASPGGSVATMDREISEMEREVQQLLADMDPHDRRAFAPLMELAHSAVKDQVAAAARAAATRLGGVASPFSPKPPGVAPFSGNNKRLKTLVQATTALSARGPAPAAATAEPPMKTSARLWKAVAKDTSAKLALLAANAVASANPTTVESTQKATSSRSLSLGQSVAAALYLLAESVMVRLSAARISLMLVDPGTTHLVLALDCGNGVPRVTSTSRPPLARDLIDAVMATGIAVNLPSVDLEDVDDRSGPSPRNALVVPVNAHPPRTDVIGALIAVSAAAGSFDESSERLLTQMAPLFAYLACQYPIDSHRFSFDASSLHRYAPLPQKAHTLGIVEGFLHAMGVDKPNSLNAWGDMPAAPELPVTIFRRAQEKFVRREQLREATATVPVEGESLRVMSVASYMTQLERSWSSAIESCMVAERTHRQRQAMLSDAHDIVAKKQRKVGLLREVLAEQIAMANPGLNSSGGGSRIPRRPGGGV
jgi:hypothetical protein